MGDTRPGENYFHPAAISMGVLEYPSYESVAERGIVVGRAA